MGTKITKTLKLPPRIHGVNTMWFIAAIFLIGLGMSSCDSILCAGGTTINTSRGGGDVVINIENLLSLRPPEGSSSVSVSFSGNLVNAGSGTGEKSFSANKVFRITQDGISPAPTYSKHNLQPGEWSISVRLNEWAPSCSATIAKDGTANLAFTYGNGGCSTQ